ncbi:RNA N6-adenosine-methyltransferase mettl16-like [Triticum dicoccoides]|uniref:RNA N6-adenosine-methyltransferase mettl16-like n=1 Tax=Triticum dicoccoides TaxID=85692 RepID=UPI000E78F9CB|nr:RNA N6-adenosine-methyltransferase mettl16-like [Triticum dicoccoides]
MGGGRKRRRRDGPDAPPVMHPRNRYAAAAPDFAALASLYPSFAPFVTVSGGGRASVDFTDFAATRELTRVLLLHDHGVNWWIPDGQLCPTVPNRSNYIHWIEDLLSSDLIPRMSNPSETVRGFDIGTGANCIYPLLGASLLGWSFVGSDVTDVALEWAKRNVESNPHLAGLIEIRNANEAPCSSKSETVAEEAVSENIPEPVDSVVRAIAPIFVGVVKDSENFDFCMCNPPFFESMEEAGLNPKTSCAGTAEEMACPGGEQAFITHIIEDSVSFKNSFRWFTSMVGRKANLKLLASKVREAGASVVKTTEFVQGQTARWGLAWSFIAPRKNVIRSSTPGKVHHSFMLQGLRRGNGAFQVLKSAETFFCASNLSCKTDSLSFSIDVTLPDEQTQAATLDCDDLPGSVEDNSTKVHSIVTGASFRISVFEQMPGTLLIKGSLLNKSLSGTFTSLFSQLEETLKTEFVSKDR